ncbi:MAG: hypothetical protein GF331_15445 [Chitinivibrionales bacterium]|nr:hypothetical protein [Chitinivibrionales bacterium]
MPYTASMQRGDRPRSGMALGGLGAGSFELRKDGIFYNWHIFNNQPFGSGPFLDWPENSMLFFVVRYEVEGEDPRMKVLQVDEGPEVAGIPNHVYTVPWITGVDRIDYEASYPFSRLRFSDKDMPFVIDLEVFSPFIPHNVKDSALPGMYFDFTVSARTTKTVKVMLLATLRNGVAYDVDRKRFTSALTEHGNARMFEMGCELVDPLHVSYGTQAMASLASDSTYYLGWEHRHPYYEILIRNERLPDIDDTSGRNYKTDEATGEKLACGRANSTIGVARTLRGRKSFTHTFAMAWHCPNLYSDATRKEKAQGTGGDRRLEGHYYDSFFDSASAVTAYLVEHRARLRGETAAFHRRFHDSTLPPFVLDQVSSHLNTFTTSSWLTEAMDFGIQEGMNPDQNFGPLATIDVAMYGSVSTAALFPELDKCMMRAHRRLQQPSGEVCHGIGRNFAVHDVHEGVHGRLDLPSQYVILALRGYFWTGDREYLEEMWPSAVKAIEYVLRERDMNGDLLPDMEGAMCTYDNFPMYGAASYVSSLWLAALSYAVAAAGVLGDSEREARYTEILLKGAAAFEDKLWNGSYFRLYNDKGGPRGDMDEGCLTDQIIGRWAMHFVGADEVLDTVHVRKALRTVLERSYQRDYGLLNCRWPEDVFLHPVDENCWSDQANTCWSGVELAFASFLLYEGFARDAFQVIRNVDNRYRKAGMYFDHQEFGGHYYRAMSAWAILNAAAGLSIRDGHYTFGSRLRDSRLKLFFAFGDGTGHFVRETSKRTERMTVEVCTGALRCRALSVRTQLRSVSKTEVRVGGRSLAAKRFSDELKGDMLTIVFDEPLEVEAGRSIAVRLH